MTTWDNLFNGYNPYTEVLNSYPNLYTLSSEQGSTFDLYHQFIQQIPYDIRMVFVIYFTSLLQFVGIIALIFICFMPLLQRAKRWPF